MPIADQTGFLLKTISSLYRILIAQEQCQETWSPPADDATHKAGETSYWVGKRRSISSGFDVTSQLLFEGKSPGQSFIAIRPSVRSFTRAARRDRRPWMRKAIEEHWRKGKAVGCGKNPVDKWVLMMLAASGAQNVRNPAT